jgi:hypothetical protein
MKTGVRVVLDVPDDSDSDEKVKINHATCLKICRASEFMSLPEFCQLKQHINYSSNANDRKNLA